MSAQTVTTRTVVRRKRKNNNNKKTQKGQRQQNKRNMKKQMISDRVVNKYINAAEARSEHFRLSNCARDYAHALVNPFVPAPSPACIPDMYDLPSKKGFYLLRGSLNIGTNNCGFIGISALGGNTQTNNDYCAIWSDSTYTGSGFSPTFATTGCVEGYNNWAPYTLAQLGVNFQVRTVAAGVRVRYIGTELNRAGRIIPIHVPTFQDLHGASAAQCLTRFENKTASVNRSWHSVTYFPTLAADYQYGSAPFTMTDALYLNMGILIDGATPGSSFEFEIAYHKEFIPIGGNALDNVTASHTDIPGMSAIRGFFEGDVIPMSPEQREKDFIEYLKTYVDGVDVSGFVTKAAPFAAKGVQYALGWK